MEDYTTKQAICDTFLQAVEEENFKNGAFRGQITKDTSFEDASNIFLTSNAVPDFEKEKYFHPMRRTMAAMDEKEQRNPNNREKLLDIHKMSKLCAVFSIDKESQYSGGTWSYDAPMLVQKVEPGLEVIETYTFDNDGNRKDFADGQYEVDPGAPEWYKRMQAEQVKPFVDGLNKDKAESAGVHDGDRNHANHSMVVSCTSVLVLPAFEVMVFSDIAFVQLLTSLQHRCRRALSP